MMHAGGSFGHALRYKTKRKAWLPSHKKEKQSSKIADKAAVAVLAIWANRKALFDNTIRQVTL